jgi:hypothetical protein
MRRGSGFTTRNSGASIAAPMQGLWILLLEMALVLAIAAFIVWWTTRK